ncbi:hypothetical protein J2799_000157 [Chryseobacterium vietnamense]|uniref:hypothetical protein n=1 Tax=Chryseobacterium sp. NRRL B-14798 TaxID=3162880 RepID=UPI00285A0C54|nr:hypothetical protein [Chryseobacterium vietnamense]
MTSKKYYFQDKSQNIISEDQLIGKKMDEIECFLADYQLQKLHTIERVYILKKTFFGIFKIRLYLYLSEDTVYNYTIQ